MVGSQAYLIISLGIQVDAMLDLELFRFLEPPLDDAREREQTASASGSRNVRTGHERENDRSVTRASLQKVDLRRRVLIEWNYA